MFVVTVVFVVEDGRMGEFMPLMIKNANTSLSDEPGCHRFDVCNGPDQPNAVFLYEVYEDAAAFETHKTMPHFLELADRTDAMVTGKTVQTYTLMNP